MLISFFRTFGGTIGVSVLGGVLASHVSRYTTAGLARLGTHTPAGSSIPALPALPAPVRSIVEDAFGHGTGDLFLYVTPFALLSLISILCIKEVPLRTSSARQAHRDDQTGRLWRRLWVAGRCTTPSSTSSECSCDARGRPPTG